MAYSFTQILERALREAREDPEALTRVVEDIIEKGYAYREIRGLLERMEKGRLDDDEVMRIQEAIAYIDETYD